MNKEEQESALARLRTSLSGDIRNVYESVTMLLHVKLLLEVSPTYIGGQVMFSLVSLQKRLTDKNKMQ